MIRYTLAIALLSAFNLYAGETTQVDLDALAIGADVADSSVDSSNDLVAPNSSLDSSIDPVTVDAEAAQLPDLGIEQKPKHTKLNNVPQTGTLGQSPSFSELEAFHGEGLSVVDVPSSVDSASAESVMTPDLSLEGLGIPG